MGAIACILVFIFALLESAHARPEILVKYGPIVEGVKLSWPSIKVKSAPAGKADLLLFEEQGYQQARQRFLQMDFFRRSGRGSLSELMGPALESKDRRAYAVGLPQAVQKSLKRIRKGHPKTFAILKSFSNGVNRYLKEQIQIKRKLTQIDLLNLYRTYVVEDEGYVPEFWTPADSIAVGMAIAFFQSSVMDQKLVLGSIYSELYVKKDRTQHFKDFLDVRSLEPPQIKMKRKRASRLYDRNRLEQERAYLPFLYRCQEKSFPYPSCSGKDVAASNAWAVRPKFAGGKQAILANDPHLPMRSPSMFMEMALDSKSAGGNYRVKGMAIVGTPGILIGHNDFIAWGMTNSLADADALYIEALDENEKRVLFRAKEVPIREETYRYFVREGEALNQKQIRVRWVPHHGPIVSDHLRGLSSLPKGSAISYRWTGHDGTLSPVSVLDLNRAKNFSRFKRALRYFDVGSGSFIYADRKGNIGFFQHGKFPIRDPAALSRIPPFIPQPGTGDYEWKGFRTQFAEIYNPKEGFIVITNDDPYGRNTKKYLSKFKDYFSFRNTEGIRAKRIADLLRKYKGKLGISENQKIQFDHKDLFAKAMVEQLGPEARKTRLGRKLAAWNFEMDRNKEEPLIFYSWFYALLSLHFKDLIKLGLYHKFVETPHAWQTLYHQIKEANEKAPQKTQAMLIKALELAESHLRKTGQVNLKWGEAHRLRFVGPVAKLFKLPLGRDGGWHSVDVGGFYRIAPRDGSLPNAYPNNYGASFRMITLLPNKGPIEGVNILPAGQIDAGGSCDACTKETQLFAEGRWRALLPW